MSRQQEHLQQVLETVVQDKDLSVTELPKLDLYMEQVISLFEAEVQEPALPVTPTIDKKKKEKPHVLTKTMINNYSKEGLLLTTRGKKYSPSHLLQMQLIYHLKKVLPISEIKQMMDYLKADLTTEDGKSYQQKRVAALNQCFLQGKDRLRQELPQTVVNLRQGFEVEEEGLTSQMEKALDILCLGALAAYAQKAASMLIAEMPMPAELNKRKEKLEIENK